MFIVVDLEFVDTPRIASKLLNKPVQKLEEPENGIAGGGCDMRNKSGAFVFPRCAVLAYMYSTRDVGGGTFHVHPPHLLLACLIKEKRVIFIPPLISFPDEVLLPKVVTVVQGCAQPLYYMEQCNLPWYK